MNTITPFLRMSLATGYAALIVLPCVLIALLAQLPHLAVVETFLMYAFALLPIYYLDFWLFGGIGYHSPTIFAVLTAIVAVMLWPLPLLSATPTVWGSTHWRRTILSYGAVFLVFVILAAWWMSNSWELFFG